MKALLQHIDQLLRGGYTRPEDLRAGRIPVTARALGRAGLVLGLVYGVFMGLYGVLRPENASFAQLATRTETGEHSLQVSFGRQVASPRASERPFTV